jgi:4'-phosphopantetheinyl transferase
MHRENMVPLWKILQSELTLAERDIHIWRANLDLPNMSFQKLYQTLSVDEKVRAKRFHFERDRKRFIVAHGTLRAILACYLSVEPSRLQFFYGTNGKPALADTSGKGTILFNMSDSEGLALYAFTRGHDIGIDIECIRDIPEMYQIIEGFFSEKEKAILNGFAIGEKKETFFRYWTRKEAILKATGQGLLMPLSCVDVAVDADRCKPWKVRIAGTPLREFSIQDVECPRGYMAAVAATAPFSNSQFHAGR